MHRRFATAALLASTSLASAQAATVTPRTIASFRNMLGINTHMNYTDGRYDGYGSVCPANPTGPGNTPCVQGVLTDLSYIGIYHVRDGVLDPNGNTYGAYLAAFEAMAGAGISFTAGTGFGSGDGSDMTASQTVAQLATMASIRPATSTSAGSLAYVEGPNEVNSGWTYGSQTGNEAALAWMQALYQAKNQNSVLRRIYLTDFTTEANPSRCVIGSWADEANEHPYPNNGNAPGPMLMQAYQNTYAAVPKDCPYGLPKSATEDGYASTDDSNMGTSRAYCSDAGTACAGGGGDPNRREVSQDAQAEETLDLAFDAYSQGLREIDFYQLLAAYPDPYGTNEDAQYGWFNYDGTPKPVATAFHNMSTLLTDSTSGRGGRSFGYSFNDGGFNTVTLQNGAGSSFWVIAYQESPNFWNAATDQEQSPTPINTDLVLPSNASGMKAYYPLGGTTPAVSCTNCSSLPVTVRNQPVMIEVTP